MNNMHVESLIITRILGETFKDIRVAIAQSHSIKT